MNKKVILMILDGWGITQDPKVSAIYNAKTPFINGLYNTYPHAELRTDGLHVGLPEGQMGNSEVGHMNLGAGRIVYQNLARINKAVKEKTLGTEEVLLDTLKFAKENNKDVHLLGLVSDGGIHAHINHLKGILDVAKENEVDNVYVHAFSDGRDCDPKSGTFFMNDIQEYMKESTGELASVTGRYYAMDRDNRWERVKEAYDGLVHGIGTKTTDVVAEMNKNYEAGITDEFHRSIIATNKDGTAKAVIKEGDVVLFFNYRTDRGRELTNALSQNNFPEFGMKKLPLYFTTITLYDEAFRGINVIYNSDNIKNTLGEVLSNAGKKQIRIAETEKYPHVTFFFSGGQEAPFTGESRILKNSPKVATRNECI
jgi:2,3-bisphosphoglycerate-independent phosphoglycerate mutase